MDHYKISWLLFSLSIITVQSADLLLMKLKAGSSTFNYDSPYWTNNATLNPESILASNNDNIDAKLHYFNTRSIQKLKLCYGSLSNCYIYDLGMRFSSAAKLFSSNYIRSENLGGGKLSNKDAKRAFTDVFLPPGDTNYDVFWNGASGTNCGLQLPGINTKCNVNNGIDNNWARIGYCVNLPEQPCQSGDKDDADSSIGFGLRLQQTPAIMNAPFGSLMLKKKVMPYQKQGWLFAIEEEFFTFAGDCDVEGDCIGSKNYPGVYGNWESCWITMTKDASVNVRSTLSLEKCCDNLLIRKVNVDSAKVIPKSLNSGETFMWSTDSSVTDKGWQICFFASIYFTMAGDCDVAGDCVSSSNHPTTHGHNEQCTVTMIQDASVTVGSTFSLETCCDHLMIHGNYIESPDAIPLTFNRGERFSWSSDSSVSKSGWQLCFSPYVALP